MRLRSKLGSMSATELVSILIITLATFVVLALFFDIRDILSGTTDKACAVQVREAYLTNKFAGREYAIDIDKCQTARITLEQTSQQAIKQRLAEELRSCWQEWGEGEYDLFNLEGEYCHSCAVINFDQSYGDISDFQQYLDATRAPGTAGTYSEFLQGVSRETEQDAPPIRYTVSTTQPLRVLFWYNRQQEAGVRNSIRTMTGYDITPSDAGLTASSATLLVAGAAGIYTRSVKVGAAVASASVPVGGASMLYARQSEGWYTISGIYLTPDDPSNYYVQQCEKAASVTVSP